MDHDFSPTEVITTKEAAELTGYSAAYFRQLIARGGLDARKIGRDCVLDRLEVLEYGEEMRRRAAAINSAERILEQGKALVLAIEAVDIREPTGSIESIQTSFFLQANKRRVWVIAAVSSRGWLRES
ncbi:MAG: helix-turn-helix domain-containing protein [bacterium]